MEKAYLNDYLFHFNIHKQLWSCFKREDSTKYFNEGISEVKAKDFNILEDYLHKKYNKSSQKNSDNEKSGY